MARELLGIATGAESEAVKLAAVKDALDRAGLGAKAALELSVAQQKPWEDIMAEVAGVAIISRAESRARRGIAEPAVKRLTEQGVPTPRGGAKWYPTTVGDVLKRANTKGTAA